jgi:hypothetical protein
MSDETKKAPSVSRRDALRLASAVSALGVGLGASLVTGDASASATAQSIHQIKIDGLKVDSLVLTLHKLDANAAPAARMDLTPAVTQNLKLVPGTYFLKLTAFKSSTPVVSAVDAVTIE